MSSPIHNYDDVFRPRAFILIDGKVQQDMMDRMVKFEFEDEDNKMDKVEITLANENQMFTDDERLVEGQHIEVYWGYPNNWSPKKRFRLVKTKVTWPENGQSTATLVGFDQRDGMNKIASPKNWGSVSSSSIAAGIAKKYGLTAVVEASNDARKQSRTQPANITDIQFLMEQAAKINFECYVTGSELHYHPIRMNGTPTFEYTYFTDPVSGFLSFSPEVNQCAPGTQGVAGVDPKTGETTNHADTKGKEALLGRAVDNVRGQYGQRGISLAERKSSVDERNTYVSRSGRKPPQSANVNTSNYQDQIGQNADGSPIWGAANAAPVTHPSPETNKQVIAGQAQAVKQKGRKKKAQSTVTFIGNPQLFAKQLITLSGVGKVFGGIWRCAGTKHTIDMKYVTSVKVSKNGIGTPGAGGADKGDVKNTKDASGPKGQVLRGVNNVRGQYTGTYSAPIRAAAKTSAGERTPVGQNADGTLIYAS